MPSAPRTKKIVYRPSIDGLRAVAVILVIAFHVAPGAMRGGFIGVDIFFVISGFLISTILYSEFDSPTKSAGEVISGFYARRIKRIFPSLVTVLTASYFMGFSILFPGPFAALCESIVASAGFCLNLLAARQSGYFDADALSKPLLHIWSLGVEEQFYLVWPLVIFLAARARLRLLPFVLFLAGCSFCLNYCRMGATAAESFFLPQMRFWELSVGSIAAIAYPHLWTSLVPVGKGLQRPFAFYLWPSVLAFVGSGLIGAGVILIKRDLWIPGAWLLLPTAGAACIICAGEAAWINKRILAHPLAVWIGLISYPLYLWHWPLLTFSRMAWEEGDTPVFKGCAIVLSVVLAWLTYLFIEMPIRRGPRGFPRILVPSAAMVGIGLVALFTYRAGGLPDRFPKLVQDLDHFEFKYPIGDAWRAGTYFLTSDNSGSDFRVDEHEIAPKMPVIFLWGDSHAAQLYPGYKKYFADRYSIVQRTAINTGPFLGMVRSYQPEMRGMNDFIFETVKRMHPDIVVLAADWYQYDWQRIDKTILALKGLNIRHITVIGPVPHWKGSLPQQLLIFHKKHPDKPLPKSMRQGSVESTGQIDVLLAALCERLKVEYLSPYKFLADDEGFLTRIGDRQDNLVAWDYSHLTVAGSEYLVSQFPKKPE